MGKATASVDDPIIDREFHLIGQTLAWAKLDAKSSKRLLTLRT